MSTCAKPIAFDTFVAYWCDDLDASESDALEAHVFSCASCTALSERVAAVTERMRSVEPAMISSARLAELRTAGRRIEDNFVSPGERKRVVFSEQEMIIHRLGGLDCTGVDRVGVVVRSHGSGEVVAENPAAPFDATTGEVLIACQRHFSMFPPDIEFEITTFAAGAPKKVTRYVVDHDWALT